MKKSFILAGMIAVLLGFSFPAGAQETPPEQWSVQDRWSTYVDPASKLKVSHKVANDGVVTVIVSGSAEKGTPIWDHIFKLMQDIDILQKPESFILFNLKLGQNQAQEE